MNIVITGIIIFVITFLLLSWFARQKTQKIAKGLRSLIIVLSLLIAIILAVGGRILFSLPLFFLALSALKIKGLTAFQMFQLWRLIQFLRNSGRFSQGQFSKTQGSTGVTTDDAYKLLGLKKGCSKDDAIKAAAKLQKKIHPDVNRDVNTEELSKLVNEAKEKLLKELT